MSTARWIIALAIAGALSVEQEGILADNKQPEKPRGIDPVPWAALELVELRKRVRRADLPVINYTPHTVTVRAADGTEYVYPASGIVPRVAMAVTQAAPFSDGCPTIRVEYGAATLPDGHSGPCIVSTMFADAYRRQHGDDGVELYVPDSGPSAIRSEGQIVAVRALIRR